MNAGEMEELVALRAQRDAGMFTAMRLHTEELAKLRALRDLVIEFDERWLEGDMDSNEVRERLQEMRKVIP